MARCVVVRVESLLIELDEIGVVFRGEFGDLIIGEWGLGGLFVVLIVKIGEFGRFPAEGSNEVGQGFWEATGGSRVAAVLEAVQVPRESLSALAISSSLSPPLPAIPLLAASVSKQAKGPRRCGQQYPGPSHLE